LIRIFENLGSTFPTEIDLHPVLERAIVALEVDIVARLIKHGIQSPPMPLSTRIRVFITHNASKNFIEDDLYTNFKQILITIIPTGAHINFCESDKVTSDISKGNEVEVDSKNSTQSGEDEETSESGDDSTSDEDD